VLHTENEHAGEEHGEDEQSNAHAGIAAEEQVAARADHRRGRHRVGEDARCAGGEVQNTTLYVPRARDVWTIT
jgi:hypothetical protein